MKAEAVTAMIPDFGERGYLPAGVHPATLSEVVERFGRGSEVREAQSQSLQWLMPLCKAAGIARWLIDGSFVTAIPEPNDVDCVLLQGPAYRRRSRAAGELRKGIPFLEIQVVSQKDFDFLAAIMFATDRNLVPKGLVEVIFDD